MKVLLDPGHGGNDPGAVGNDIQEKDIALEVALRVGEGLIDIGHDVLFTRDRDEGITPAQRLIMIREYEPEAFISIHCNSAENEQAHGIETIWKDKHDYPLAKRIHWALIEDTGRRDRGLKQDGSAEYKRNLAVLKDLETPACLVEIGFISNEEEAEFIKDNIELMANAIAEGINRFAENV